MFSKRIAWLLLSVLVVLGGLVACSEQTGTTERPEEGLLIVTSFSILADIIQNVTGERGHVDYIVPIGDDPHEYEPVPSDFRKISQADVFYLNGFDLEEWLERLASSTTTTPIVEIAEGITPIPVSEGSTEPDPHAWLSVEYVKLYVQHILADLIERDPEGESYYQQQAAAYLTELDSLNEWILTQTQRIPEENRVIVLSENAFKYFGLSYGFETLGIWELNSHEEGTPRQIERLVNLVKDRKIPALFVESTIDRRYMEAVSISTGVPIAGKIYTDALGPAGSGAETYIEMIRHNVNTIVEGLSKN
jgi:iron/zinc/copper transport system substrate-binding protein